MSQHETIRLHCKALRLPTIADVFDQTIAQAERDLTTQPPPDQATLTGALRARSQCRPGRPRLYRPPALDTNVCSMLRYLCNHTLANCPCCGLLSAPWQDPSLIGAPMDTPSTCATEPIVSLLPGAGTGLLPIPPLPASASLDPSLPAGASVWLDTYVAYASTVCPMLPPLFHESAALWLASVAVARRLYVPMSGRPIYPDLFVAWIGPNAIYETAAAFDLVRSLAERAFPGLLAPSHMTPLDLLFLFARCIGSREGAWQRSYESSRQDEHFPAQRGWLVDDLRRLLPTSRRASHNSGLGLLVAFYQCHPRYRYATNYWGFLTVPNTYLSLLSCTTPATIAGSLSDRALWDLGWWSSFALILPEPGRPAWQVSAPAPEPPALLQTGVRLFRKLPGNGQPDHYRPCEVELAPDVAAAWLHYRRALAYDLLTPDLDARLWNSYSQFPVQLIKVATLLAALDWVASLPADPSPVPKTRGRAKAQEIPPPENGPALGPTITLPHLARAQSIVEAWRASLHRALAAGRAATGDLDARILRQIEKHGPAGATLRDVYRGLADRTPNEVASRLAQLVTLGLVETIPAPDLPGPGRPTTYYRVAR